MVGRLRQYPAPKASAQGLRKRACPGLDLSWTPELRPFVSASEAQTSRDNSKNAPMKSYPTFKPLDEPRITLTNTEW